MVPKILRLDKSADTDIPVTKRQRGCADHGADCSKGPRNGNAGAVVDGSGNFDKVFSAVIPVSNLEAL